MKRALFALVFSLAAASAALAADLPLPQQAPVAYVPVVAPVYNWGGIYVGINGGWGFGSANWTATPTAAFGGLSSTANDNGGVVGGTLGFNYQMNSFVFGVEGDFDYSGINTGTSSTICTFSGNCQTGNNWLATLRGRAGYAADRVLFYITAGGAFGSIQTTFNGGGTNTTTQAGWTAGAGVEWAFADNWSAKFEYLYVNLGNGNVNCATTACLLASGPGGGAFGPPIPVSVGLTDNLVRAGINYKFNF
jgi:outer membrane immunogenic protein